MARRLEELEATVEILSDPDMRRGLLRGLQDAAEGRFHSHDEVFKEAYAPYVASKRKPKRKKK